MLQKKCSGVKKKEGYILKKDGFVTKILLLLNPAENSSLNRVNMNNFQEFGSGILPSFFIHTFELFP
jgi:hypothetical protein